jgi:hypothetical protein
MRYFPEASVALVPYWLKDSPRYLANTDHAWWFEALDFYQIVVYVGPYVNDAVWQDTRQIKIAISTQAYTWHINEILLRLNKHGLLISDITLVWNVLEASATCRVLGLDLIDAPKIAIIADTHHLGFPISSLLTYLLNNSHTYVLATHNQHAPFFGACLQIPATGWPFPCEPTRSNPPPKINLEKIYYYGNTLSHHHKQRTLVVNYSLVHTDVQVVPRLSFSNWRNSVSLGGKVILGCTLNGSPSFQTYYSLLNFNLLISDPIAPSSWLGSLMQTNKLCMTYRNKEDCVAIIKTLAYVRDRPHLIAKMQSMVDRAAHILGECVNCSKQYGLAFLDPANGISSLKVSTTEHDSGLLLRLNLLRSLFGLDYLLLTIKMFEQLQEQHRIYWRIVLVLDASSLHSAEIDFWSKIYLLLPRVTTLHSQEQISKCTIDRYTFVAHLGDLRLAVSNM